MPFSRTLLVSALILGAGCSTGADDPVQTPDALASNPGANLGSMPGPPDALPPPATAWRLHWSGLENCASWGADARVHVYFDVVDGQTVDPPRHLQADCSAGAITAGLDLGAGPAVHAMFTIESPSSGAKSSPSIVWQDVHENHDLSFSLPARP
jgi:hypothetical protein